MCLAQDKLSNYMADRNHAKRPSNLPVLRQATPISRAVQLAHIGCTLHKVDYQPLDKRGNDRSLGKYFLPLP